MGESRKSEFCLNFDNSIRLDFHGIAITSDAGLLAYRELDHALGLKEIAEHSLSDYSYGKKIQHGPGAQLRPLGTR
jgi:hypothetical protein